MPPFIADLTFNATTREELADHGLILADALDVLDGNPKFFPDKGRRARRRRGLRQRWIMIGPGPDGALLTFIVDDPDEQHVAHLVTGWRSSRAERTRYHQPGGRGNRP